MCYFPLVTIFSVDTSGACHCFARRSDFEGQDSPWSYLVIVKWEVPDDNHKEMYRQLLHYNNISTTWCEALAFITLTFTEAHTRYKGDNHEADANWLILCQPFKICFHCCGGCSLFAILFLIWSAYLDVFKPKCYECQDLITDWNNDTFDKA